MGMGGGQIGGGLGGGYCPPGDMPCFCPSVPPPDSSFCDDNICFPWCEYAYWWECDEAHWLRYHTTMPVVVYTGPDGVTLGYHPASFPYTLQTYEFIPGLNEPWCPGPAVTVLDTCVLSSGYLPIGISGYHLTFNENQIKSIKPTTPLPESKFPLCEGPNYHKKDCHPNGLLNYLPIYGLSDFVEPRYHEQYGGVDVVRPWYTSISSYKDKILTINHLGIHGTGDAFGNGAGKAEFIPTFSGVEYSAIQVAQGATYFSYINPLRVGGTGSNELLFTDRTLTTVKSTSVQHVTSLESFSTNIYSKPHFIDGNKAVNTPQIALMGASMNDCGTLHPGSGCTCNSILLFGNFANSYCSPQECSYCTDLVCVLSGNLCCDSGWNQTTTTSCPGTAAMIYNEGYAILPFDVVGSDDVIYKINTNLPPGVMCGTTYGASPGTTAEGDVFGTVWGNITSNPYQPFGFDYFSVSEDSTTNAPVALVNYPDYNKGVFGERPDLLAFRIATMIYPSDFMKGYNTCAEWQGQTSCHRFVWDDYNFTCDLDAGLWTTVFYNQIAVGARHAVVTLGNYAPIFSSLLGSEQKNARFLIQFSGQTFGEIDTTKTTWSTHNIDLTDAANKTNISMLNPLEYGAYKTVNKIVYANQKDKLYEIGLTGIDPSTSSEVEFRVLDSDNNVCSYSDGKIIAPNMCVYSRSLGFTSCFARGITLGHADHPIWNDGITAMPYISIIDSTNLCADILNVSLNDLTSSWDWVSAGNTGETCAICRCTSVGSTTRHAICWGGRFDQSSIPVSVWDSGLSGSFIANETYLRNSICELPIPQGNLVYDITYSPCQIDIKGESPVIYYRTDPYAMQGGIIPRDEIFKNLPPVDLTYNIKGKTKYWDSTVWSTVDSFGDVFRGSTLDLEINNVPRRDNINYESANLVNRKLNKLDLDEWYVTMEQTISTGMQFTPNYPLISSSAWLANRYSGYDSDCGCETLGACCISGVCSNDILRSSCINADGAHFVGQQCEANTCSTVSGACCTTTGVVTCEDTVLKINCSGPNNTWEQTTCALSTCFNPLGACCVNGTCIGEIRKDACLGVHHPGKQCSNIDCTVSPVSGACCKTDGTCIFTNACLGVHYLGKQCIEIDCNVPPVPGACCQDNNTCTDNIDSNACQGVHHPDKQCSEYLCAKTGSDCCHYFTGPCCYKELDTNNTRRFMCKENQTPTECFEDGGIFLGFNHTCEDCVAFQ